jgi:hypothetical protein
MKFCYADPPYPGQAKKHYGDDPRCAEVDHAKLIRQLESDCDGWALSTGSVNLWDLARLTDADGFVIPETARIGAWVKPFASFKPGVNPAYAWEPVIFHGGRARGRTLPTVRDWVSVNITLQKGTHGAKPNKFNYWLFEMLGMEPMDEFIDLFPGSGAVTTAWETWKIRAVQTALF